jgi:predicted CxxxxCH...CXXCH cytochrome family protein
MAERGATPAKPRATALVAGVLAALSAAALQPSCLEPREHAASDTTCTSCHGDEKRSGDLELRAAPPGDLRGARDTAHPGVGAHQFHLRSNGDHARVACSECHVVPARVDDPGHIDDAAPAELSFGPLASAAGHRPAYDREARTCGDSYCHRAADAVWTEPRDSEAACGSCHGLPPPSPHPQSERCSACHGDVIHESGSFVSPELHVDGRTDTRAAACSACHGDDRTAAPPADTLGNTSVSARGVGAHRAHLLGGQASRALECGECHAVPTREAPFLHVDGLPAELRFTGVAGTRERTPEVDPSLLSCTETWCHGPGPGSHSPSPAWTSEASLGCTSCHGLPPAPPHPQLADCSSCHGEVVHDDDRTIVDRTRHVDGVVDLAGRGSCTSCHGGDNAAPPRDLAGNTDTAAPGVGAHQLHLQGSARARAALCEDCHRVPQDTFDAGHLDSELPAEVVFGGAAVAFGGEPSYAGGRCTDTGCHGGAFPEQHRSGGSNVAPSWTDVGTGQAACGSCHALPPPAPHPRGDLNPVCSACHHDIADDNLTFLRPELHVDGIVTFELP